MQQTDTLSQRLRHRRSGASEGSLSRKVSLCAGRLRRHKPPLVHPRLAPPGRTIDAQAECSDSWTGNHAITSPEGKDSDTSYRLLQTGEGNKTFGKKEAQFAWRS